MTDEIKEQPAEGQPNAGTTNGGQSVPSQEDLNRQFAERAKRAEESERKRLLELFGVQSEDDLKAIAKARSEETERSKSELQKVSDKLTAAEARAKKLEEDASSQIAQMQKRIMDSEIKQYAGRVISDKDGKVTRSAFRVEALDDILLLVDRSLIVDKDGVYEGIEKALDALAKSKPYLLADGSQQTQKPAKGTPQGAGKQPAGQPNQQPARPSWSL